MIKLEDRPSVVILCIMTFMSVFYALMFINDGFAAAFAERLGSDTAPNEGTLFWMAGWGYIYLALAVGNMMAILAPASESRVFLRTMSFLAIVALIRALGNTIIADEVTTYAPLIAQFLVLVGYSVVLTRTGSRLGKHFGWV